MKISLLHLLLREALAEGSSIDGPCDVQYGPAGGTGIAVITLTGAAGSLFHHRNYVQNHI